MFDTQSTILRVINDSSFLPDTMEPSTSLMERDADVNVQN